MKRAVPIALVAGLLFGAGLAISGMADPARVRAFLDVLGHWDPTLAFVMAGAMLPMAVAWRIRARMPAPITGDTFHEPDTRPITASLVVGALLFGIGWGLSGLCPGPAIADIAVAPAMVIPFLFAMVVGFAVHHLLWRALAARSVPFQPSQGA
ncbi:DUF6691 family protein [Sphingomonas oryzagri]